MKIKQPCSILNTKKKMNLKLFSLKLKAVFSYGRKVITLSTSRK